MGRQGVIFLILLIVAICVYIFGGMLYTYHTERVWAFPNRTFWRGLFSKCCKCSRVAGVVSPSSYAVHRLRALTSVCVGVADCLSAAGGGAAGTYTGAGTKGSYVGGAVTSTPYSDI